jgi:hypothetical protein
MWTIIFGLFLAAHGLIHLAYVAPVPPDPKYPFNLHKSWLITSLGMNEPTVYTLGMVLSILTVVGFALAGLAAVGLIVPRDWWGVLTLLSALLSLLLLGLFWHPWLVLGVVIDLALILAWVGLDWQPFSTTT